MFVNCPKCGFSQPKDRYCANCGVDMDHFIPKEVPAWKKLLTNPYIPLAGVFMVVFAAIFFIRQQIHEARDEEIRSRVELLKSGPVVVEKQATNSPAPPPPPAQNSPPPAPPSPAAAPAVGAAPPASPANSAASVPTSTLASPVPSGGSPRAASVKPGALRMTVIYAEVDRTVWTSWQEEMQNTGLLRSFDGVRMGPLNQADTKLKVASGFKVLQKIERTLDQASPNQEWFVGTHHGSDPENEMGLFSSLALNDTKDGMIHGDLEVQRAFRDPKDPTKTLERTSFGSPFELTPGSAFVMSGLLTRKYATEMEEEMNPDSFLGIFKSRNFLADQSVFTLILEFDTSGK